MAHDRAEQSPQQGRLIWLKEFVKDEHRAPWPKDSGHFGKAVMWVRHNSQYQMQHGMVEASCCKGQTHRITLNGMEIDALAARQSAAKHPGCQIDTDVVVLRRQ
jgi:hypothetical protein